jgi:RHH-type rel operon transcriptional repressor/antitoxin RelB
MLAVRLPRDIEKKLDSVARKTGRTKSFYVRQLLVENFDDLEDVKLADKIWESIQDGAPVYDHAEVKKILNID